MNILSVLCSIALYFLLPFLAAGGMQVRAAVLLNEIFPKPTNEESEWIELYNTGTENVSLEGWKLQNSAGDVHTYIFPAGVTILGTNFFTVPLTQSGVSLFNEGDTVILLRPDNSEADRTAFPSILGTERAWGRSVDGGGGWTMCAEKPYSSTQNKSNNCPLPTPTNTPVPTATLTPTNTPIPTPPPPTSAPYVPPPPIDTPQPIPTGEQPGSQLSLSQILGATDAATPTPTPDDAFVLSIPQTIAIPKILAVQILAVLGAWAAIGMFAVAHRRLKRKTKKKSQTTQATEEKR